MDEKNIVITVSKASAGTADAVAECLGCGVATLYHEDGVVKGNDVRDVLSDHWRQGEVIVFVGAMGICVRCIAPFVSDKHTDPAVICVDGRGKNVIPVLSGHVGGANDAARHIADAIGARAVVTTLSDGQGLWQIDTMATRFGWTAADGRMNRQIALFTSHEPTALLLDVRDRGTEWMEDNKPSFVDTYYHYDDISWKKYALLISVSPIVRSDVPIPHVDYVPRCVHVGIGIARQAQPADDICRSVFDALANAGIARDAVADIATIDAKRGEPVIGHLENDGWNIRFYSSDELKDVSVPTPSEVVAKHVGTPSVAEAAAVLSASRGPLVVTKVKGDKWTVAAAIDNGYVRRGRIEIVGAGPGDPDLVSVRGRRLIERADLILYAGSLVPQALTRCAKPGAVVRSSASLSLEEQVTMMKEYYDRGALVVRLHTGDPCIYGAVEEQMALFDKYSMRYNITPGISAFQAAAAVLRSQFTIPGKTQTIILTRGEGRTPVPWRERLRLLARSRSTMCIYLSADVVENIQRDLLEEYPAETPVAVCYRLTWPEERVWRGTLSELTDIVRGNGLSLGTLIVVGEAIGNREGRSELYSPHFSHLYRKGSE